MDNTPNNIPKLGFLDVSDMRILYSDSVSADWNDDRVILTFAQMSPRFLVATDSEIKGHIVAQVAISWTQVVRMQRLLGEIISVGGTIAATELIKELGGVLDGSTSD